MSDLTPQTPQSARILLEKFLNGTITDTEVQFVRENNMELRLTPLAQVIEGNGTVIIAPPQVIVEFIKKEIETVTN